MFAPRQLLTSTSSGDGLSAGPDNELRNYQADLECLSEDTDAVQYWLSKEPQYKK